MARGKPGVDILGNEYGVGDTIAAAINSYSGPTLLVGVVQTIQEERIAVRAIGRTNYAWKENTRPSLISPERVVKLG
jgi:hypothetical protein